MSFVEIFSTCPHLIEEVFSNLSLPDLVNSSLVCVSWYEASNKSCVWKAAIERSTPKDRFRKLSDLDRYTGIASNYDENHCFQVDRQSPCNLSPMNPWKLSLCQNNFVQSNWHGKHNTILARHQIKVEDSMWIDKDMRVEYPSKSPQDCLYFPILVSKGGPEMDFDQPEMDFDKPEMDLLLIRLDGTPRISQKILSTESVIPIICIDRGCMVWVQDGQVKYLSPIENEDSSQIENLGILTSESGIIIECSMDYMMTMNDKYIVAGFKFSFVKIWCRKTKQLKLTYKTHETISNVNCYIDACYLYNEHIYFKRIPYDDDDDDYACEFFLEIYDIKKDKSLRKTFFSSEMYDIAVSDKYYAIYVCVYRGWDEEDGNDIVDVDDSIRVYEIETDVVKYNANVSKNELPDSPKVWIVDDMVLYIDKKILKILSLVDGNVSNGISVSVSFLSHFYNYNVCGRFLLANMKNLVVIWDWKLEIKLHELRLDEFQFDISGQFHNDETRLIYSRLGHVNVIGFW